MNARLAGSLAAFLAGACPALADGPAILGPAILAIEFGPDRLEVAPPEILTVEVRNDYGVPFVLVKLDPSLQFALASMTLVHVGQIGRIMVCGRVVSEPLLQSAITGGSFVIANGDAVGVRRLATILRARTCTPDVSS